MKFLLTFLIYLLLLFYHYLIYSIRYLETYFERTETERKHTTTFAIISTTSYIVYIYIYITSTNGTYIIHTISTIHALQSGAEFWFWFWSEAKFFNAAFAVWHCNRILFKGQLICNKQQQHLRNSIIKNSIKFNEKDKCKWKLSVQSEKCFESKNYYCILYCVTQTEFKHLQKMCEYASIVKNTSEIKIIKQI